MPENKNQKTVDIDTSGPEVDVEFNEDSTPVQEFEVKEETVREVVKEEPSSSTPVTKVEKQEASDEKTDTKKDELEDYSEGVQRRIAKLTKKMREAERQREEAVRYAQTVKAEKELLTKRFSSLETSSLKDRESKIVSAFEAAKAKLGLAREAGDIAIEIEAQREIAKLGYEEARLQEMKDLAAREPIKQPLTISDVSVPRQDTPIVGSVKAESWGSKNKWFGSDKPMTYTAFDIHRQLVDDEGYDAESDEYYAEIDKRIRLEFPHKFDKIANTETTKPTQVVASAKRSVKPGRKTVRLTPSQVAIAKKLGVPLEEYAKQLNITKEV
jgi:myosin heavy subunit